MTFYNNNKKKSVERGGLERGREAERETGSGEGVRKKRK